MGKEYTIGPIGLIGTAITIFAFIIIGILIPVIGSINRSLTPINNLLLIAYASLAHATLPVIGTIPLLPYNTILAMAITYTTVRSSVTSMDLVLGIIGSLPFAVGGVMTGYGFYGFHKQEGSTLSLITSLIMMFGFGAIAVIIPIGLLPQTIISPWASLIYTNFSVLAPITETTIGWGFGISIALTAIILFVGYIFLGTTMIVIHEKTPKRDLMLAAGILTIIGILFLILVVGAVLLFVAYILLHVVFHRLRK